MSLVIQYIAPLLIVITVYTRIFFKIKRRIVNKPGNANLFSNKNENCAGEETSSRMIMNVQKRKQFLEQKRQRRTNILLFCIAMIFALSWLPINIVNLLMDIMLAIPGNKESNSFRGFTTRNVKTIQAICLLVVMCSACTNPFLYSWLNVSFKEKFRNAICCLDRNGKNTNPMGSDLRKSMKTSHSMELELKKMSVKSEIVALNNHNKFEFIENTTDENL